MGSPLVSIGMPVYNEEQFLERALKSLLAQDYQNWELNVCDNGSTDRTLEIAQKYARKDARIQVHTAPHNRGADWNFNRALQLSRGKYFMWAPGDDQWHPSFISKCLEVLESDPKVVLAYPRIAFLDGDGKELGVCGHLDTRDYDSPIQRFLLQVLYLVSPNTVYGLIRRDVLKRIRLLGYTAGVDYMLLSQLSFYGPFANVPHVLFFRQHIRPGESREQRRHRYTEVLWAGRRIRFPYLRVLAAYLDVVWKAPVSPWKKVLLSVAVPAIFGFQHRLRLFRP